MNITKMIKVLTVTVESERQTPSLPTDKDLVGLERRIFIIATQVYKYLIKFLMKVITHKDKFNIIINIITKSLSITKVFEGY